MSAKTCREIRSRLKPRLRELRSFGDLLTDDGDSAPRMLAIVFDRSSALRATDANARWLNAETRAATPAYSPPYELGSDVSSPPELPTLTFRVGYYVELAGFRRAHYTPFVPVMEFFTNRLLFERTSDLDETNARHRAPPLVFGVPLSRDETMRVAFVEIVDVNAKSAYVLSPRAAAYVNPYDRNDELVTIVETEASRGDSRDEEEVDLPDTRCRSDDGGDDDDESRGFFRRYRRHRSHDSDDEARAALNVDFEARMDRENDNFADALLSMIRKGRANESRPVGSSAVVRENVRNSRIADAAPPPTTSSPASFEWDYVYDPSHSTIRGVSDASPPPIGLLWGNRVHWLETRRSFGTSCSDSMASAVTLAQFSDARLEAARTFSRRFAREATLTKRPAELEKRAAKRDLSMGAGGLYAFSVSAVDHLAYVQAVRVAIESALDALPERATTPSYEYSTDVGRAFLCVSFPLVFAPHTDDPFDPFSDRHLAARYGLVDDYYCGLVENREPALDFCRELSSTVAPYCVDFAALFGRGWRRENAENSICRVSIAITPHRAVGDGTKREFGPPRVTSSARTLDADETASKFEREDGFGIGAGRILASDRLALLAAKVEDDLMSVRDEHERAAALNDMDAKVAIERRITTVVSESIRDARVVLYRFAGVTYALSDLLPEDSCLFLGDRVEHIDDEFYVRDQMRSCAAKFFRGYGSHPIIA